MKVKKILLVILNLAIAITLQAQADYDLNTKTIRNDGKVGGELHVVVQIRATATKATFNIADFTLSVAFSNTALTLGANTNPVDASRYEWQGSFVNHLPNKVVNQQDGGSGFNNVGWNQFGTTTQIPAVPLPIGTAWVDMLLLKFTILSTDRGFLILSLGPGIGNLTSFNVREVLSGNTLSPALTLGNGFTEVVYNGTNWTGGNGVNNSPDVTDACKRLYINAGIATLNTDVECDIFQVASGAKLIIAPNATLKSFMTTLVNAQLPTQPTLNYLVNVSDDFLIDANATGYGQYIGPGLPGTIKQWVGTDAGWRNMAFPVSGGTAYSVGGSAGGYNASSTSFNLNPDCAGSWGNYINTVNVYRFNKGPEPHEWYGAPSATTGGTEGYNIFTGAPFGTNGIATIKGTFLAPGTTGTFAYTHSAPHVLGSTGSQSEVEQGSGCITEPAADRQANWNGWALVANPFPCNLDVEEFAIDNGIARDQIRIWNRVANAYVDGNAINGFNSIPPMQAFWIKIGDPTTTPSKTIVFQSDQRVFSAGTFQKYPGNQISLTATNLTTQDANAIHLQFNNSATKGYDQLYDAYVLSQPGDFMPQLAFHNTYEVNGKNVVAPLDYNTVPDVIGSDSYQLRFWSRTLGQFIFNVDTTTMLPSWNVYIEDKLIAPNTYVNITHSGYPFSYNPATDSPTRFVMHFAPSGSLDIKDETRIVKPINAYAFTDDKGIRVAFKNYDFDKVNIQIHNPVGQLLTFDKNVNTDELYLYPVIDKEIGFYSIRVLNPDGTVHAFKVIR